MRKGVFLIMLSLISALSCKREENLAQTCSTNNPAQDLPWLRREVEAIAGQDSSYAYIQQGNYQGQTVFIFGNCCPFCNSITPVYNCQGEVICTLNSQECPDLSQQITNVQTIAKARLSLCKL